MDSARFFKRAFFVPQHFLRAMRRFTLLKRRDTVAFSPQ
jgi:hypothetical protein